MDPKQLSKLLFNDVPKEKKSIGILNNNSNQFENIELSEILINILFYGLEIMHDDLKTIDIKKITCDDFSAISSWFESLGYKVNSEEFDLNTYKNGDLQELYYAKIVLNQDENKFYFQNGPLEDFRFVFNGDIDIKNEPFKNLDEFNYLFLTGQRVIFISFTKLM